MENCKSRFAQMIRQIARQEQLLLTSYAYDWVFRLVDHAGHSCFLYGYKFPINNAAATALCDDKAALSEHLETCGTSHIPHRFFMSPRELHYVGQQGDQAAMCAQFAAWHNRAVIKPNTGTGGHLVTFVKDRGALLRAADRIFASFPSLALSPFVPIAQEYRVVMLDDEVQLVFEKQRPYVVGDGVHSVAELAARASLYLPQTEAQSDDCMGKHQQNVKNKLLYTTPVKDQAYAESTDNMESVTEVENEACRIPAAGETVLLNWKHNLGQGAFAKRMTNRVQIAALEHLALDAARNADMRFASVDIVRLTNGTYAVLEINSGVMLEHFAAQSEENYNIARDIYRRVIRLLFHRPRDW